MLPLIPQDKANHEVYGARIACACAILVLVLCSVLANQFPLYSDRLLINAGTLAAIAALVGAFGAGKIKELLDARANAKAVAAGLPPPHSVENADIVATGMGGVDVSLPLFVIWLVTR